MMNSHSGSWQSQDLTEDTEESDEVDPLVELDRALTRYLQRYGQYRLHRRDSGDENEKNGLERQQSAISMLGSIKSADNLSVISRSAPPSRGLQQRGGPSLKKRGSGELTDGEYETFMSDLIEEAHELALRTQAAIADGALTSNGTSKSEERGSREVEGTTGESQSSGSSWYCPSAGDREETEEIDITLMTYDKDGACVDDHDCGMELDWRVDPLRVNAVIEGGIAEKCGIQSKDEIIRINAFSIREVGEERFCEMLKWLPVTLTIQRLKPPDSTGGADGPEDVHDPHRSDVTDVEGPPNTHSLKFPGFDELLEELRAFLPSRSVAMLENRLAMVYDHLYSLQEQLAEASESIHGLHQQFEEEILTEVQRLKVEPNDTAEVEFHTVERRRERKLSSEEDVQLPGTHTARVRKGKIIVNKKDLDEALRPEFTGRTPAEDDTHSVASCSNEPPLVTDV
ncbi:hypothetical protein FOZ63_030042 [Perkinsus olseni]|uniref:PDZ domain-containing protein n=2 Tax=Perkinsus olseni TaxID=32597 RepID=A0A7J6R602_PEROL|nr:hypothetical protein FOZ63_030042 [Perkinsus olseni]